ncbi:MAG: lipase-like domain-containing protein [Promethearchaeota archaeon]
MAFISVFFVLVFSSVQVRQVSADSGGSSRNNDFPIVFIHGFGGYGPGECFGINMWGGLHSIPDELRARGYTVYELKVGPFSSNWDRACEAFAELKGGTVDYGAAHSNEAGHHRYGRTFKGLYPQWGQLDENGHRRKIHIIGHSMGGQTARVLSQLLSESRPEEGDSELFEAHDDWVCSITTFSTPHDGTTLKTILADDLLPGYANALIGGICGLLGTLEPNPVYDPMLDQWDLNRQPGESIVHYLERAKDSGLFDGATDFGVDDLGPEGAAKLNEWCQGNPDVYYFSYAAAKTREMLLSDHHVPKVSMTPIFYPMAIAMGAYDKDVGSIDIDSSWFENDGVVNTRSERGPTLGHAQTIIPYNGGTPVKGAWNFMGTLDMDHLQVVGWFAPWRLIRQIYTDLADLLGSLPEGDAVAGETTAAGASQVSSGVAALNEQVASEVSGTTSAVLVESSIEAGEDTLVDSDGDTLPDAWETAQALDPMNSSDAKLDSDNDGIPNWCEYVQRTGAKVSDTDKDGMPDGWESEHALDPLGQDGMVDYDGDTLGNLDEYFVGTDPWKADTDGDGARDDLELAAGTDPLDPWDWPYNGRRFLPIPFDDFLVWLAVAASLSAILVVTLFVKRKEIVPKLKELKLRVTDFPRRVARLRARRRASNPKSRNRAIEEKMRKYFASVEDGTDHQ